MIHSITEAQLILDKAEMRELPVGGPRRMHFEGGPEEGVLTLEVEGSFTAEEFEAMSMILRAAAL